MSTRGLNIDAAAVVAVVDTDGVDCVLPATKVANRSRGSTMNLASRSEVILLFESSLIVSQPSTDSVSTFFSLSFPLLSLALVPTSLFDFIRGVTA